MPSAVSGFTNQEAPSADVVPSGNDWHCDACTVRNCEYIAPPITDTVLPSSACAAGAEPAATTTPAPSFPTGIDSPTRAPSARMNAAGIVAVTVGLSAFPLDF